MTAARRRWKSRRKLIFCLAAVGLAAIVPRRSPRAATTERIVSDPSSGLAIGGFDPVAYFTEAAPRLGSADLELSYEGVVWRFVNEGNRAAFKADPDVYMPRFGGYDPIALARGAGAAGHPELWVIADERLYLFFSADARDAFIGNPAAAIHAAERGWPVVLLTLSP
jgi:YHS domain-containing protein